MMVRIALLALAVGAHSPMPAYGQGPMAQELGDRLDPRTARAVQSLVDSARVLGIPGEPLVAKALEGQSKGAGGERIVLAVRTLVSDLGAARQALGPAATKSELVAGAGALRAGASSDALTELRSLLGSHSLLLPLATLSDLISRGVPVTQAEKTVMTLAKRGASEADYRAQAGAARPSGAGARAGTVAPIPTIPSPPVPKAAPPGSPPAGERPDRKAR